jgi:hypothetical protein
VILTLLIKQLTEAALKAELEAHMAGEEAPNRKTIKSTSGNSALETPCRVKGPSIASFAS